MVANGRGLHTDAVVDLDVGSERVVAASVREGNRSVGTGSGKGARDVIVAAGQRDAVGELILEGIDQRGQLGGSSAGEQSSLGVGEMEELQGENRVLVNRKRVVGRDIAVRLVAQNQQFPVVGRIGGRHEQGALGTEIASPTQLLDEGDIVRVGHVVNHHVGVAGDGSAVRTAWGAFNSDEGEDAVAHLAHGDAFWLRTLVVGTGVVKPVTCERDESFDVRATVEDDVALVIEYREGSRAIHQDLVDVAVAIGVAADACLVAYGQIAQFGIGLERGLVREDRIVQVVAGIAYRRGLVRV